MIEAGAVVLERDQLRLVADSISYAKVFNYLEEKYSVRVTRASVHDRIWESHNHFRQDVLNEALGYFPTILPDQRIIRVFEAALKIADNEPTAEQRVDTFVRLVFAATGEVVLQSPARRHLQSAKAISSQFNDLQVTDTFPTALNDHLEAVTVTAIQVFDGLTTQLGIEPDTTIGLDANTISYLAETLRNAIDCGAFLNSHAGSAAALQPVRFGGVNQLTRQSWFPASIGQNFLVRYFYTHSDRSTEDQQLVAEYAPDPDASGLAEQHLSDSSTRRPREELRKLVLAGGVDLLLNTALELKPASITYANVFKYIKETTGMVIYRASVHKRIWDSQEDFVLDVLNYSLSQTTAEQPGNHQTEQLCRTDGSTSKSQTAQNNIRLLSNSLASLFSESTDYRRLLLTKVTLFGKKDQKMASSVSETIQRIDDEFVENCKQFAESKLLSLGFDVRPELQITEDQALNIFGVLLLTVVSGLNLDHMAGVESSFQVYKLPSADGTGELEEWNLEGIAAWVFFDQLFVETA